MSILISNCNGDKLILHNAKVDILNYHENPRCFIEIIEGSKIGEGAEIEEQKIYDAIIDVFNREI